MFKITNLSTETSLRLSRYCQRIISTFWLFVNVGSVLRFIRIITKIGRRFLGPKRIQSVSSLSTLVFSSFTREMKKCLFECLRLLYLKLVRLNRPLWKSFYWILYSVLEVIDSLFNSKVITSYKIFIKILWSKIHWWGTWLNIRRCRVKYTTSRLGIKLTYSSIPKILH